MLNPCQKCLVKPKVGYKYCKECKTKVAREQNAIRLRKLRSKDNDDCERCHIEKKWSSSGTTKYCYKCKVIVHEELVKEKNAKAMEKRVVKKRKHKKLEPTANPRQENAKAMSRDLYADHHIGIFSKEDMSNFRYLILLRDCIKAEKKSSLAKKKYKGEERVSGSEKLARRKAIIQIDKLIVQLLNGSPNDQLYGRQLKLEKEYINVYEKQLLIMMIEEATHMPVGGSYTLAEAGDILGVTRERARQIESGAEKVLNHPMVARKLKAMMYD